MQFRLSYNEPWAALKCSQDSNGCDMCLMNSKFRLFSFPLPSDLCPVCARDGVLSVWNFGETPSLERQRTITDLLYTPYRTTINTPRNRNSNQKPSEAKVSFKNFTTPTRTG